MQLPLHRDSGNELIERYVATAYDTVKSVADNQEIINSVGNNISTILTVSLLGDALNTIVHNLDRLDSALENLTVVQLSGDYTLSPTDDNKRFQSISDSPITITIPEGLPHPFSIGVQQIGLGQISFVGSPTVEVNSPDGGNKTETRFVSISILSYSADRFVLNGRIT